MKFHAVHGINVQVDEGGSRATRTASFCDGLAFGHKPLCPSQRLCLQVAANEDWTGALRLGVTALDPAALKRPLPRYACPDLTARPGFWARPLPEKWAANGNRLTFYVNSKGQFHLFVNNEHKGAILTGLPVKEQLWVLLDLYGITVAVKFISHSGSAPTEVIARGPEAVQAYQNALSCGSASYYHTRLALIGPPDGKKTILKKLLVKSCEVPDEECDGIDTTCFCQTSESEGSQPWGSVKNASPSSENPTCSETEESAENEKEKTEESSESDSSIITTADEEFFKAIAINIVREMVLQRKKSKDRKKTPGLKNTFRLQSSLSKLGTSREMLKQENSAECLNGTSNDDLPDDLPKRVVELVDAMLKESECKLIWEKKENEKQSPENIVITFNIWNYSGHAKYLFLHQLFLSPQTIYLFVFDLSQDLDAPFQNSEDYGLELPANFNLSLLTLLHIWLEMIYISIAHPKDEFKNQAQENVVNDLICPLFPPVLIVGIQEESTTFDSMVEHQFNKIKESIQDKVYYHLVHPTFYYIGNPDTLAVDSMIDELRTKIEELALQLPHFGNEIPLKWMLFEQAVDRLIEREVYFADLNKLSEVARLENIESDEEFYSMVHFYHHQGKIWHLGSDQLQAMDNTCGIVILKPQWFINHIYQLMSADTSLRDCLESNENELQNAFSKESFQSIWPNAFHHISILLDILDSSDVLCEVPKEVSESSEVPYSSRFMIPWLLENKAVENTSSNLECLILILDFAGLLPVGFFTRFIVRLLRWSAQHDWKGNANLFSRSDEVPVDYNHSIRLQKIHGHRIQVTITQRKYLEAEEGIKLSYPSPHICSKVRHLLERETEYLRDVWYKRLSYSINIPCPCTKSCALHEVTKCADHHCIHLLPLNECLTKKVLECDYRLVKTDFIQKYFFSTAIEGDLIKYSDGVRLSMDCMSAPIIGNFFWNDSDISREDSPWITIVGKMLTCANTGQDWIALAKRLGYNEREIRRFSDEVMPPVSLLNNWIDSNGRTRYCIDLLIACLEQMGRQDVAKYIMTEIGPELPSPPVFISYQWESQEAVLHLRRRIELAGFPCWMDVGHIQGGEALYGKIYEGINKAKVVLCCLTPRYVLSPLCTREMSLADVLRKPIVPIMLEPTPWPPPGALALILSSLVYVDLCGIGGHGGSGKYADWETRFSGIVERLSHFISPTFLLPRISNPPTEKHAPPPPTAAVMIRNPEEFLETLGQQEERETLESAEIPLAEGDSASESASISDPSPVIWEHPRRNRVVRCSVCVIL